MLNNKINDHYDQVLKSSSPILLVSSSDLETVIRRLAEEYLAKMEASENDVLLTVKETAALLDVNRSTLWHWEQNGYLKPVRVGRKVRYRMGDIKQLTKGGRYGREQ